MAIKTLNTRIQLKYDTLAHWQSEATADKGALLVLKKGELGIVEIPTSSPTAEQVTPPAILFKVGDGATKFKDLPWTSALAADVYTWAKKANPDVADFTVIINKAREGLISADSVVKSLEGMKGDINLSTKGYLSKSLDNTTKTITIATAFSPKQEAAIESGVTVAGVEKYEAYDARITAAKNAADGAASGLVAYKNSNDAAVAKKVDKTTTVNGHALSTDVIITKADVGLGNVENKPLDTAVSSHSDHYITSGAVKTYVDGLVTGSVQYLGTVASISELNALSPDSPGDFCRVSAAFGSYHAGDLLLCKTIPSGSTAATWDVIHGEIDKDTWVANSATADGYVAKGNGHANKVWKTDANGVPAWRDDDNTHQDISNLVPYTGATKDINIGTHSFTMSSVFTVGSESSVYTQTTPGSIVLKNPIGTLSIGISSLTVNGTTIYWPTVSADPNGKYFALKSDIPTTDNLVPYTGAINDINIGDHKFSISSTNNTSSFQSDSVTVNDSKFFWPSASNIPFDAKIIALTGDIPKETTVLGWGFTKNKGTVTKVTAGTGLKITGTATVTPNVEIDEATTFIFDCGSSTENI